MTTIDGLKLRRIFGRNGWLVPEPFGPDGWRMEARDRQASVIATAADHPSTGVEWLHASIARVARIPDYDDLVILHKAVFPGYAYQVFAPPEHHINIHAHALHLWGRADGEPAIPSLAELIAGFGSI